MNKDLGIKILFIIALLFSIYLIISGLSSNDEVVNDDNEIYEEDLRINPSSVSILIDEEAHITAFVLPENTKYKTLTWISSNPNIATVNDGLIKGISPGNCVVSVTTEKRQIKKIINVKVSAKEIDVSEIQVNESNIELEVGDTKKIEYTVLPNEATNKKVSFLTSDKNIVGFNQEGLLVGVSEGDAIITLRSNNNIEAKINIKVKNKAIPVSKVTLNKKSLTLEIGKTETLTAKISPTNATNKNVIWSSSNENVATVSSGKITAKAKGTTTITVKTEDGSYTSTCNLTVKEKEPDSEQPIVPTSSVYKYESSTFKYYVTNTNRYYLTYIWMQDPANQIKKLEANTAKYGKVLKDSEITGSLNRMNVGDMMNNYISKGLIPTNKAAIGFNASGFYVKGAWNPPSDYYNNRSSSWLVITDGIITRARTDDNTNTNSLMVAIDGNGNMKVYDGGISKADREKTVSQMKSDNVRNTWSFAPLLISNGTQKPWGSTATAKRQGICQVNANNYIMLTAYSSMKIDDVGSVSLPLVVKQPLI